MRKRTVILLLMTFAAAAWCAAQVATQPAEQADPPRAADLHAACVSPASQPDGLFLTQQRGQVLLTAEQRDEVLAFLKTEQPDLFKKLAAVRESAPQRFTEMVQQLAPSVGELIAMRDGNPKLYGLYKEEMKVGREIDGLCTVIVANQT